MRVGLFQPPLLLLTGKSVSVAREWIERCLQGLCSFGQVPVIVNLDSSHALVYVGKRADTALEQVSILHAPCYHKAFFPANMPL